MIHQIFLTFAFVAGAMASPIMFGSVPSTIPDPNAGLESLGNLASTLEDIQMSVDMTPQLIEDVSAVYDHLPDIAHWEPARLEEAKQAPETAFLLSQEKWTDVSNFCRTFKNDVGYVLTPQVLQTIRDQKYSAYSEVISSIVSLWNICELANNFVDA